MTQGPTSTSAVSEVTPVDRTVPGAGKSANDVFGPVITPYLSLYHPSHSEAVQCPALSAEKSRPLTQPVSGFSGLDQQGTLSDIR